MMAYLSLQQHIQHIRVMMFGTEVGAREEVCQALDQCTSTQEMQHTASQQHLPGSTTSNSVSFMTRKQFILAHPGISTNILHEHHYIWLVEISICVGSNSELQAAIYLRHCQGNQISEQRRDRRGVLEYLLIQLLSPLRSIAKIT